MSFLTKNLKKENNIIRFFIFFSTIIVVFNFSQFVFERSLSQYSDWLINYQGGFVRRGLAGEVFFKIFQITNIPLDIVILIFVSFFYILFAVFLAKIIEPIKLSSLNWFIIFSPFSFLYPVMEQKISGRKDILFLCVMSFLAVLLNKIKFNQQKFIIILSIAIVTLSHSGFFIYVPFIFLIYLLTNYRVKLKNLLIDSFIIVLATIFLFLITILNSNIDSIAVKKICESISVFYLENCGTNDYISTLSWTLEYEISLLDKLWNKENYILFYSLAFILSFLPLIYALINSKFKNKNFKNISPFLIFVVLNIITFPIYYIGADYGRYMYITYVSTLILYFKALSTKLIIIDQNYFESLKLKSKKYIFIILIFLYSFTWTVPHCCNNSFKLIYKKPFDELIENLN